MPPHTRESADPGSYALALGLVAFVLAASMLAVYLLQPPWPLPASAPATAFSAYRALAHDRVIASVPHPAGSPANDKVAAYLVETLNAMGVAAELHQDTYVHGGSAGVRNAVLARIPGTAHTKAFAMMAHYDSVPYGPGALDDCGGVIAMLETARALKAGPPLMNDVIFVFTDAEEAGMLGARAFAEHPWLNDVGVLLNLEARGTQGPSFMFETSPGNGWLIAELAKSDAKACASSLMYDVYKRMPFNSDFRIFKPLGIKGFNIAFIDNFAYYHTMNDNPDNASPASVQHHGSYALGLARHFGSIPLDGDLDAPDAMYFNTVGTHLVHYPLSWGTPLAVLAAAVFVAALVLGFVRRHLSVGGLLAGMGAFLLAMLGTAVSVGVMLAIIYGPRQAAAFYLDDLTHLPNLRALYDNDLFATAFVAMTVCVVSLVYGLLGRVIRVQNLAAGALVFWLAPLALLAWYIPGGSYLAMWPLLFSSLGLAALFLAPNPEKVPKGWVAVLSVFALPGIFLVAPGFRAFLMSVMIMTGPALVQLVVLMLGLLAPQLVLATRPNRWWLPATSGVVAVMLLVVGLGVNRTVSPARPKLNSVAYGLNHDTGEAFWMSADEQTDEWTSQHFPPGTPRDTVDEFVPGLRGVYLKAPAPRAASLPGARIEVVRDTIDNGDREIALRVTSPAKAARLTLRVTSDTRVRSAALFGQAVQGAKRGWDLRFNLFPQDGVDLVLRTNARGPLAINAIERFYGQPDIPGIRPRPTYMAPEPNTVRRGLPLRGEHIYVTRTFTFPVPTPGESSTTDLDAALEEFRSPAR